MMTKNKKTRYCKKCVKSCKKSGKPRKNKSEKINCKKCIKKCPKNVKSKNKEKTSGNVKSEETLILEKAFPNSIKLILKNYKKPKRQNSQIRILVRQIENIRANRNVHIAQPRPQPRPQQRAQPRHQQRDQPRPQQRAQNIRQRAPQRAQQRVQQRAQQRAPQRAQQQNYEYF